jgi:pyrrolidone-carboxylate peptidase
MSPRPASVSVTPRTIAALLVLGWSVTALAQGVELPSRPSALLFGFEPYAEVDVNPTGAYVRSLVVGHPERQAAVLSVSPPDAMGALFELMEARPKVIIGFGVRVDVEGIEINTAATNWISMRTEGELPYFGEIEPGLPSAVSVRESWRHTLEAKVRASGGPVTLSSDAGLHVCNLTFLQALIHAAPETRVLFIHVAPDLLSRPGLATQLTRLVEALLSP